MKNTKKQLENKVEENLQKSGTRNKMMEKKKDKTWGIRVSNI